MRRYLSNIRSSSSVDPPSHSQTLSEKDSAAHYEAEDDQSTAGLLPSVSPSAPLNLGVKRVDYYYSRWNNCWKYRNSGSKAIPEMMRPVLGSNDASDQWRDFCFVVVRKLPMKDASSGADAKFQVVVKSPYLIKAVQHVLQDIPGISWTAEPLELDPHLLIAFLPQLEQYRDKLLGKRDRSTEQSHMLSTLKVLLEYLNKDYRSTIAKIRSLISHGEITFELLYAILIPRTVFITDCPSTGALRCVQLRSSSKTSTFGPETGYYDLLCESVDAIDDITSGPDADRCAYDHVPYLPDPDSDVRKAGGSPFGRVQHRIYIPSFEGTVKINELAVYPIKYHSQAQTISASLVDRGRKWVSLRGVHHMQYKGNGAFVAYANGVEKTIRYTVNSRVIIDRANFRRLNPGYQFPTPKKITRPLDGLQPSPFLAGSHAQIALGVPTLQVHSKFLIEEVNLELSEEELLLTPPVLYGFSLSDKVWLELNVELVQPIEWNDEAFASLVLPPGRKALLQSLIEAHNSELGFDDFVRGKGLGLVINLYGPPGVGKTLSAEATSEHVRRPLYVIGGGDLGVLASDVDRALEKVFDIATTWKAIVLIDEADVFLEQRSLHDLKLNAIVSVFLRHVEYYRGILFMTTNRVQSFDEAFLSRIHVALHFEELTKAAKMQVWSLFLSKVGVDLEEFGQEQLEKLAEREINGRQIKNATRTAHSLAVSRGEKLGYVHIEETLVALVEFISQFATSARRGVTDGLA